jgi:hypothetical protein
MKSNGDSFGWSRVQSLRRPTKVPGSSRCTACAHKRIAQAKSQRAREARLCSLL